MREAPKKRTFFMHKKWEHHRHTVITVWMMNYYHGINALSLFAFAPVHITQSHFHTHVFACCVTRPNKTRNKMQFHYMVHTCWRRTHTYGSNTRTYEWFAHLSNANGFIHDKTWSKRAGEQANKHQSIYQNYGCIEQCTYPFNSEYFIIFANNDSGVVIADL